MYSLSNDQTHCFNDQTHLFNDQTFFLENQIGELNIQNPVSRISKCSNRIQLLQHPTFI